MGIHHDLTVKTGGLIMRRLLRAFIVLWAFLFIPSLSFGGNVDGRQTVTNAGTAVSLGTGNFKSIDVCAETDNTNAVTVGFAPVGALATRAGIPLFAGDCWHYAPVDKIGDLSKIYIDAITNTEGVTYTTED